MAILIYQAKLYTNERKQPTDRMLMKKCYVSVLISVVKLSFNKMNTG